MSDSAIRGSCVCGGVKFEITGETLALSYCHCSRCRKLGGMANVTIRARDFRWLQGEELVTQYRPEPPFELIRCFCKVCGPYLGEPATHPTLFPVSAHVLDDDARVRPILHERVEDKPAWCEILDDLLQYPGDPPRSAFSEKHKN